MTAAAIESFLNCSEACLFPRVARLISSYTSESCFNWFDLTSAVFLSDNTFSSKTLPSPLSISEIFARKSSASSNSDGFIPDDSENKCKKSINSLSFVGVLT